MSVPLVTKLERDGALLRITLSKPPGNIIDSEMVTALRSAVVDAALKADLKTVLIDAAGDHFSFGASVEEHLPDHIQRMLTSFHALAREMLKSGKVFLAAVHGQCLGGGLELALICHRIFATPTSKLGNPEIKLGVFAPLASAILPLRVGQARADDLLLTGRSVNAQEALALGLVDELSDDPAAAAVAWHEKHLSPLSASSLAHAVRAARQHYTAEVLRTLDAVERSYLEDLMHTEDAVTGIESFIQKRRPEWKNK